MITSRDIARQAGVSQATVSRVLNDHPNVATGTRERVLKVLKDMQFVPNGIAAAMVTGQTGAIGVMVEDITNPFYPELLEAISRELGTAEKSMILWNTGGSAGAGAVKAIQQRMVDGVIFTAASAHSVSLRTAEQYGTAVVLVNRTVKDVHADSVTTDNLTGGQLVARYLVAAGHTSIGLIGGPHTTSTAADRVRGFRDELRRHGVPLDSRRERSGQYSHRFGHEAMLSLLSVPDPPTAVFCANDVIALGAMDAARAQGRRVPEELWIIGFDDIEMASWEAYDLTTVRQPTTDLAKSAVQLLLGRLAEPHRPARHLEFPGELRVRSSTANTPLGVRRDARE